MKRFLFSAIINSILLTSAYGQMTYNGLKVKELTMPSEDSGKALFLDSENKVKSSSTPVEKLEYLNDVSSSIQDQFSTINSELILDGVTLDDHEVRIQTNESVNDFQSSGISNLNDELNLLQEDYVSRTLSHDIQGTKSFSGKLVATSTANGSRPCPILTDAQMIALVSPQNGDCVYNSTKKAPYYYSSTDAKWKLAGGGAGGSRLSLLIDGSFEDDAAVTDGGVCVSCTVDQDPNNVMATTNNENSLKITFSAAGSFTITKNHSANFANAQGYVTVYVYTTASDVNLYSMVNGSTVINRPVNVIGSWYRYEILTTMGNTSFGYRITKGSAGDVYIDESTAGPGESAISSAPVYSLAGESYFAGTTGCQPARTSAVIGQFGTVAACPGPTVTSQIIGQWLTTDSDYIRQSINSIPKGKYKATFQTSTFASSGVNDTAIAITDGVTTCEPVKASGLTTAMPATVSCVFEYTTAVNRSFELLGAGTATTYIYNVLTAPRVSTKFTLEKLDTVSTLESSNADTEWLSCGHTTSDFQGFGTVTNIETQCKRDGDDLLMRGSFLNGTPNTGIEARITLKLNGVALTSSGPSKISSIQLAGDFQRSAFSPTFFSVKTLIEPSVTYITMGTQSSTASALTKSNGFGTASEKMSFNARIPIAGWDNPNTIVADVSGLQKCTDSYNCKDTYSFRVSNTGALSGKTYDWVNGCSVAANVHTCNLRAGVFTVAPNCTGNVISTGGYIVRFTSTSSSQIVFAAHNPGAGDSAQPMFISCQKNDVDTLSDTAKAVARDQNTRTPGVLNAVSYSARVSSTDVVSNELGDFINGSCTNAAVGVATCNFNTSAFNSASSPNCGVIARGAIGMSCNITTPETASSVSVTCYDTYNKTAIDGGFTLFCDGVSP